MEPLKATSAVIGGKQEGDWEQDGREGELTYSSLPGECGLPQRQRPRHPPLPAPVMREYD